MMRWMAVPLVVLGLLVGVAVPVSGQPLRAGRMAISPAERALMELRELEMTAFLSPRSRMALAEARMDVQAMAWRGFVSPLDTDRVMARLALVARDRNLSPFDRMRLQRAAWAVRRLW